MKRFMNFALLVTIFSFGTIHAQTTFPLDTLKKCLQIENSRPNENRPLASEKLKKLSDQCFDTWLRPGKYTVVIENLKDKLSMSLNDDDYTVSYLCDFVGRLDLQVRISTVRKNKAAITKFDTDVIILEKLDDWQMHNKTEVVFEVTTQSIPEVTMSRKPLESTSVEHITGLSFSAKIINVIYLD